MPDLDIDFSDEGASASSEYVRHKYGESSGCPDHHLRSMLAASGGPRCRRVMGFPIQEVDRIAKLIPRELGDGRSRWPVKTSLNSSRNAPVTLKSTATEIRRSASKALSVIPVSMPRHRDADGELSSHVPLAKGSKDVVTTQFNDEALLKLGLLKIDFLGLRTLTVIDEASKLVRQRTRRGLT